nr:hypothetical protein CFP56_11641 [Quercus suber]
MVSRKSAWSVSILSVYQISSEACHDGVVRKSFLIIYQLVDRGRYGTEESFVMIASRRAVAWTVALYSNRKRFCNQRDVRFRIYSTDVRFRRNLRVTVCRLVISRHVSKLQDHVYRTRRPFVCLRQFVCLRWNTGFQQPLLGTRKALFYDGISSVFNSHQFIARTRRMCPIRGQVV